jgi:hypothetical protein
MIARLLAYFLLLLNPWQQPMGYSGGGGGYTGPVISNTQSQICTALTCTTLNFSPSPASGNLIYVTTNIFASTSQCTSTTKPTDTLGSTWTYINTAVDTVNFSFCSYYTVTSSGGTDAVTCHVNTGAGGYDCFAFLVTGNAASPLDTNCINTVGASTSGTGTNNMTCSASVTPAQSNELFLGYTNAESGTMSNGSLITFYNISADNGIFYQQQAAATITPAVTLNTSGVKYAIIVASFHK